MGRAGRVEGKEMRRTTDGCMLRSEKRSLIMWFYVLVERIDGETGQARARGFER